VRISRPASLLLVVALLGCGGGGDATETRLTILAVNPNVGRAEFRLSCEPAAGDLPSPERACAALRETPELVTSPEPFTCMGGTFSWWDITISGRLGGRPLHSRTSTCWTPQMDLIGKLGIGPALDAHLLPRRSESLIGGEQRTIPPGVLRPGDLVVCEIAGRRLELGIPIETGVSPETGYGGAGVRTLTLTATRHHDESVTARCS
jgi:hypothetical protein